MLIFSTHDGSVPDKANATPLAVPAIAPTAPPALRPRWRASTRDEVGRKYDPFFLALGLKNNTYSDPDFATGLVHGVWIQQLMCYALDCSIAFGFEGLMAYETDTDSRDDGGRLVNGYEILAGPMRQAEMYFNGLLG
ncbi:hypothetical protein [Burkholderia gladioli]|uniref:hypothetical protein n=1 Tax=Burkholderia gladioli TaxID=28095 RepID=UPI000CFF7796|nr:hypothetical protein [Burkholderia gladioli]PRH13401.1 hypothetical protein C6V08_01790 [Burkholderia gladioli]